jgi:uncharacterized protein YecE (DUF72 family)
MFSSVTHVHIGTSGYSYADWVGPVYPPGTRPGAFLELYARKLDFVELNFSFYRQPNAATTARLVDRAPPGFVFAAKAHRTLTHERGTDTAAQARRFLEGIAPIRESGRLVAVLLQFPYSFHYDVEARRYLDQVCGALDRVPLAVEFRNDAWLRDSVTAELRKRGVSQVWLDLPRLEGLPGREIAVTAPLGYLRFHGRNAAHWWTGDNTSRYDYRYERPLLDDWARRLIDVMESLSHLVIAFNNHYRGQAVDNALELRDLLSGRGALPSRPQTPDTPDPGV